MDSLKLRDRDGEIDEDGYVLLWKDEWRLLMEEGESSGWDEMMNERRRRRVSDGRRYPPCCFPFLRLAPDSRST